MASANSPPGNVVLRVLKQMWNLLFWGTYIAVVDLVKDIFIKTPEIDFESIPKRTNQVAVMTGGPRGIGFNIVKKLLQLDYTVILGVRNIFASEKAIDEIRKLGVTSGNVQLFNLDLKSLNSVQKFASDVLASSHGKRIDLLLNNAGIMNAPYESTEDNFESHFQVNYLGHFFLTNLLLPRIKETAAKKSEPSHIVNTSSHAQKGGRLDFDELETSKVYSAIKCYFDSKLCQVIHAKTLESKLQDEKLNIHVYAVHPGEIPTDLWMDLGFIARVFRPIIKYVCRTTDGAANTILYPLLTPQVAKTCGGQFFVNGKVTPPNWRVNDLEIRNKLWERSIELTKLPSVNQKQD